MGNLRQKYTDEEWEELQNSISDKKVFFTYDEVKKLLQEQRQLCAENVHHVLSENLREALKIMIIKSPEPKNFNKNG